MNKFCDVSQLCAGKPGEDGKQGKQGPDVQGSRGQPGLPGPPGPPGSYADSIIIQLVYLDGTGASSVRVDRYRANGLIYLTSDPFPYDSLSDDYLVFDIILPTARATGYGAFGSVTGTSQVLSPTAVNFMHITGDDDPLFVRYGNPIPDRGVASFSISYIEAVPP